MKNKKILIVDDHPGVLEVTSETLRLKLKCSVDAADSGQSALDLCEENQYSLICTDFIMPNMNGAQFIKKLRQESQLNKKTKIFILTGNPEEAAKEIQDLTEINIIKKVDGIDSMIETLVDFLKDI